jgi:hypothetical protein
MSEKTISRYCPFKYRGSKRPMRMLVVSGGWQLYQKAAVINQLMDLGSSVADPDVFGHPGSGSVSQSYGSGSRSCYY